MVANVASSSGCAMIKKWLRFKRVITVRLLYISHKYFPFKTDLRKNIILKWFFLILNTIFYFSMLTNTLQFHLSNWQEVGPVWSILASFVYTGFFTQYI